MPSSTKKLEVEALSLDRKARAQLAGKLLMSLDQPSPSEIERLWLEEAERRLSDFRDGNVKGIPAGEVFERAIAELE